MKCDVQTLEALVHGGAILGGGGGGSMKEGQKLARLALEIGTPKIVPLTEVDPEQWVVTVSAVGAPAASDIFIKPMDYVRAVKKVADYLRAPLGGLIQNEMGGLASANGLVQSAVLQIPVIDAPCNGRAHPTGLMGSLGLHRVPNYRSIQAACGGDPDRGRRIELVVEGDIYVCSKIVREASIQAGGMIAVARNPIHATQLRHRSAVGAIMETIKLGKSAIKAREEGTSVADAIARHLGGAVLTRGTVTRIELATRGGFDVGQIYLSGGFQIDFWNEYIVLEGRGKRLYTFPDLIVTLDASTHQPISAAEIAEGDIVTLVAAKKTSLVLGEGMRDPDLYRQIEQAVGKPIVSYALEEE